MSKNRKSDLLGSIYLCVAFVLVRKMFVCMFVVEVNVIDVAFCSFCCLSNSLQFKKIKINLWGSAFTRVLQMFWYAQCLFVWLLLKSMA
jgi:hypothetical protein